MFLISSASSNLLTGIPTVFCRLSIRREPDLKVEPDLNYVLLLDKLDILPL